jgi:hypothetical protein
MLGQDEATLNTQSGLRPQDTAVRNLVHASATSGDCLWSQPNLVNIDASRISTVSTAMLGQDEATLNTQSGLGLQDIAETLL